MTQLKHSKRIALGAGKYGLHSSLAAIQYKEGEGEWQDIDNYFEVATAPWDWQMLHAGYHIKVKEDFTSGQIIEFEAEDETVQFQPMALEWTNDLDQIQQISMPQDVDCAVSNPVKTHAGIDRRQGTIKWADAYGSGIDFEWFCKHSRLIKVLTVDSFSDLPEPEQYIIDGGNPVLRLSLIFDPSKNLDIYVDGEEWDKHSKVQTFNNIEFKKDGEVIWIFAPLHYWDSDGVDGQPVATLEKSGNKLYISIRVPHEWLETAAYPVFIDSSPVDVDVSASADDDEVRRNPTPFWSNNNLAIWVGQGNFGTNAYGCSLRFTGVNIPSGAAITTAYLTLECSLTYSTTVVNSDLCCENYKNPGQIANYADHIGRTRTTGIYCLPWDSIPPWTAFVKYESPSIVAAIQKVVDDRSGTGNALIVFWEDKDNESDIAARRYAAAYDSTTFDPPNLYVEYSEGGDITLFPSGIPSLEVFGTSQTNYKVFPSSVLSVEGFGIPQTNYKVFPSSVLSVEGFGTSELNLRLLLSAIESEEGFGTHQMNLKLLMQAVTSEEGFGTHQMNLKLLMQAVTSEEAFGTPYIYGDQFIDPGGISSVEDFGNGQLNFKLFSSGIASLEEFGTPFVNVLQTLLPFAVGSGEVFGLAELVQALTPEAIASLEAFGTSKLNLKLYMQAIVSQEDFGNIVLGLYLLPSAIESQEVFGNGKVNLRLLLSGIGSVEAFGVSELVLMLQYLYPSGVVSGEGFGNLVLALKVLPSGIITAEIFGAPFIGFRLSPIGVVSEEGFGTSRLSYQLIMPGIASGEEFGVTTLGLYLIPSTIDSKEVFGTNQLNYVIMPDGVISREQFGDAKFILELVPSAVPSLEVFGVPRLFVAAEQTLVVSGMVSVEVFGLPALFEYLPIYFKVPPRERISKAKIRRK